MSANISIDEKILNFGGDAPLDQCCFGHTTVTSASLGTRTGDGFGAARGLANINTLATEAATVDAQIHKYIELWFWTGLRTSEINGLEWRYVDFKATRSLSSVCWWRGKKRTAPRRPKRASYA
ncbi:site-specific integrase [Caballeronia insecticola]|uniref:hypothetical protein n=1 Tax=Caballeronia insecticola TaxID=758793 RepID=UPI0005C58516|nr:hypothetical protein [Caballeronia insecticola]